MLIMSIVNDFITRLRTSGIGYLQRAKPVCWPSMFISYYIIYIGEKQRTHIYVYTLRINDYKF